MNSIVIILFPHERDMDNIDMEEIDEELYEFGEIPSTKTTSMRSRLKSHVPALSGVLLALLAGLTL